ncbi:MAG: hypothetical protein WBQ58_04485 [Methanoregula sp.]|uniref:hypothetical protein n=1 Tax=Methanoregula sp. TaxID=2052170 RepID=UPI003BAF3E23
MYAVQECLRETADHAPGTIRSYRIICASFGKFPGVPLDKTHIHLSSENLIKYAGSLEGYSGQYRLFVIQDLPEAHIVVYDRVYAISASSFTFVFGIARSRSALFR